MRERAAPWRRLVPLALLVLALHLALLQAAPRKVVPARTPPLPFATRSVASPAALLVAAATLPAEAPATASLLAAEAPSATSLLAPAAPAAAPSPAPAPPAQPAAATGKAQATAATKAARHQQQPRPAAPPVRQAAAPSPIAPPSLPPQPVASRAATAPPFAPPPPARLHYEVTVQKGPFAIAGAAVLDWRHDGRQYEARLAASGIAGSRVQRSTGRLTPEGLAPDYFSDKARSEQATHFDRANGRLVFSNNRPDAPIEGGMQDRLSVILQLAALVAGQPAKYPPGTLIAIPTASTREADTWVFAVEGEEELALPGGAVRALKLQRLPRREYDQKVELWLAPRMDYAPVRLRLTNPNGDTVDNRWSSTDKG